MASRIIVLGCLVSAAFPLGAQSAGIRTYANPVDVDYATTSSSTIRASRIARAPIP